MRIGLGGCCNFEGQNHGMRASQLSDVNPHYSSNDRTNVTRSQAYQLREHISQHREDREDSSATCAGAKKPSAVSASGTWEAERASAGASVKGLQSFGASSLPAVCTALPSICLVLLQTGFAPILQRRVALKPCQS